MTDEKEIRSREGGWPRPSGTELLALLPQQSAFRFLDEILEVDDTHVVASYRFREEEFFYPGHFPERAITPGVILLEAMGQCGLVIQSLYLLAAEAGMDEARCYRTMFTSAEVEWLEPVYPGDRVVMHSRLLAWRRRRIRARVGIFGANGRLVAESTVSGFGVRWDREEFRGVEAGLPRVRAAASAAGKMPNQGS